jgi:hypothetical protein
MKSIRQDKKAIELGAMRPYSVSGRFARRRGVSHD